MLHRTIWRSYRPCPYFLYKARNQKTFYLGFLRSMLYREENQHRIYTWIVASSSLMQMKNWIWNQRKTKNWVFYIPWFCDANQKAMKSNTSKFRTNWFKTVQKEEESRKEEEGSGKEEEGRRLMEEDRRNEERGWKLGILDFYPFLQRSHMPHVTPFLKNLKIPFFYFFKK